MKLTVKFLEPVIPRLDARGMVFTNVTEVSIRDGKVKLTQETGGPAARSVEVAELITNVPGIIFYRSQGDDFQTLKIEAQ